MPLADIGGRVAGLLEDLGHAQFAVGQMEIVEKHARGSRPAAGHQGRPIGRADRANRDRVAKPDAFRGQPVQGRRLDVRVPRIAGRRGPPLIGQQDHDIGFRRRLGSLDRGEREQQGGDKKQDVFIGCPVVQYPFIPRNLPNLECGNLFPLWLPRSGF